MNTLNNHPDCHYIQALLANDHAKIGRLYNDYFPLALKIVVDNKGNRDDAHDVFQECIAAIFQKAEKMGGCFLETASLKTYIFVLCRNYWFKQLRKGKKIIGSDVINDDFLGLMGINSSELSSVEQILIETEQEELVKTGVAALGDSCRQILTLYSEGEKHREIGEKLNIKVNEVGIQIQRCLKKLRTLLPSFSQKNSK